MFPPATSYFRSCARRFFLHIVLALIAVSPLHAQAPVIAQRSIVNAASFLPALAAGSPASLFGNNLGPASPVIAPLPGPFPTTLGGTIVRVNGTAAPLYYVSSNQINFQMPWEMAGQSAVNVTVATNAGTSSAMSVSLTPTAPGLFVLTLGSLRQGYFRRANGSTVSPGASVQAGDTIFIVGTGFGPVTNRPASGAPNSNTSVATNAPTVFIGGIAATVLFAGLDAAERAGFNVLQVVVPANVAAGSAIPVNVTIGGVTSNTVIVPISAQPAAVVAVSPQSLSVTAQAGSPVVRRSVQIANNGGGMLNWVASVAPGAPWLSVSPAQGTATLASPAILNVQVNFSQLAAGVHQSTITVRNTVSGSSVSIPVSVAASAPPARLELSHAALSFNMVQGDPAPAPQSLRVFNAGSGSMPWTITATAGGQGFSAPSPASGTAIAGTAGSDVTLTPNPANLSPGVYQTVYQVNAAGAVSNPQSVVAVLRILPPSDPPALSISPGGLLFIASSGATPPPSQTIRVSNTGGGALEFSALAYTNTFPPPWISITPGSGSATRGGTPLQISVNPAGFAPGVYRGRVAVTASSGPAQNVEVAMIIPAQTAIPLRALPGAAACNPASLDLIPTGLTNGLVLPVSFPRSLAVQVFDNCGGEVNDATVVMNIAGLMQPLRGAGGGVYQGTITADRELAGILVSIFATHETLGTVVRHIEVSSSTSAQALPVLLPNGVVEGAGFSPQRPLAPGAIVSIFGSQFTAGDNAASSLPLPRSLGGVSVRIGASDAPLFFASPGQINAQVPFNAQAGDTVNVLVNSGGRYAAPQNYLIAPNQPGIFQSAGVVAALDSQYRNITAENPARIGDTIQIFATGLGLVDSTVASGEASPSFSTVNSPVTAEIGGVPVPVVYQGLAPGFVGLYQVNVQLTSSVPTGDAVPVVLRQSGLASNPTLPVSLPIR